MCESCGCGDPEVVPVEIREKILAENDHRADHVRDHLRRAGVVAVNLMGSPGAGKTAVLEGTAASIDGGGRLAAITGDLATERDAERLAAAGIPSHGITTGSACHLDAELVHRALHRFDLHALDFLFIENVGNLVCPAIYDLGQDANVVALSVTEGEDKPLKYPVMFRAADLVLVTKVDLLPHLPEIRFEGIVDALSRVNPSAEAMAMSATSGEGLDDWLGWLDGRRARVAPAATATGGSP